MCISKANSFEWKQSGKSKIENLNFSLKLPERVCLSRVVLLLQVDFDLKMSLIKKKLSKISF